MDNGERCETCRYFITERGDLGACRRNPPRVFPVMGHSLGAGGMQPGYQGVFPPVKTRNWCGEYKRKTDA